MFTQSFRRAITATLVALLLTVSSFLTASFVSAQDSDALKITPRAGAQKQYARETTTARLSRDAAFRRVKPELAAAHSQAIQKSRRLDPDRVRAQGGVVGAASAAAPQSVTAQSFGTGGGDINEIEPNDRVAQGVALPVNLFGEISFRGDLDFFSFDALAGQQITIEAFAARLAASDLIADIALFDSQGRLLESSAGNSTSDPLIRYTAARDETLIAGIADVEELGGRDFDYILNITRGIDLEEIEPNNRAAQPINNLPATIFGEIDRRADVDFYSFVAEAGQTLIVDLDGEALGSRLDSEINLSNPETGKEFIYNDQQDGNDSRFNIVLPYTGRYRLGVGAFESGSSGFYRLNISVVSGAGAPVITSVTRVSKKLIEVTGSQFTTETRIEVNGRERKASLVGSGILRAKAKLRSGDVVTAINPPDKRRSNPLLFQ